MSTSQLKLEQFTEIDAGERVYGLSEKYAEVEYTLTGEVIPLELKLTEYAGDTEHDAYFSLDIKQGGRTYHGDEFESVKEAFLDAEYRISELYDAYEIGSSDVNEQWEAV